jgi:ATP-binding cassette subfamily C protein CydCD
VVLAVLLGLVNAASIVVQGFALAHLLASAFASHGRHWPARDLQLLVAGIAVRALCSLFGDPLTQRAASSATAPMRRGALDVVLDAPQSWRTGADRSALTTLLTRGVSATTLYVATYLPALVLAAVAPVIVIAWIAFVDPLSAVIVTATVLILPLFMVLLGKEAAARMRQTWSETTRLSGHFGDVLRGMRTLRSFNRAEAQLDVLDQASEVLRTTTMGTLRVALLSSFTLELLSSVATALVALSLGVRLIDGSVGLATALGVLIVTPEVYLPLRRASARYHDATDGVGAASELVALEAHRPLRRSMSAQVASLLDDLKLGRVPLIEIDSVAVARDGGLVWDDPISCVVEPKSMINVVGPSGSGKSTLLRLVLGLETPSSGRVLIDGVDLSSIDPRRWRENLGWLPQHPTFPGATMREVLAMRQPSIDDDELTVWCERLGLGDLIGRDPTFLSSNATASLRSLSTGERHRLATIRTLLGSPALLILDEPFGHLDHDLAARAAAVVGEQVASSSLIVATHEPSALLKESTTVSIRSERVGVTRHG